MHWLSVVVPVRNEAASIVQVLEQLHALRDQLEIIVVDGGSEDNTLALARPLANLVIESSPGRARQMNAGAQRASGEVVLFLHADTQLPAGFERMIGEAMQAGGVIPEKHHPVTPAKHHPVIPAKHHPVIPAKAGIHSDFQLPQRSEREASPCPNPNMDPRVREDDGESQEDDDKSQWGRFDVRLAPSSPTLNLVAWMMNHRSRLTGICTGDQAVFVRRDLFNGLGGYADIPLMEDIDLSKRLKRIAPPVCIRQPVTTSSRRWQHHGVFRTITLMWWLRLQYWAGVSAARLAEKYYPARQTKK